MLREASSEQREPSKRHRPFCLDSFHVHEVSGEVPCRFGQETGLADAGLAFYQERICSAALGLGNELLKVLDLCCTTHKLR